MTTIVPIPSQYLRYAEAPDPHSPIVLTPKPEIDEFVTSATRLGETRLIMHKWPYAFAVRFEHEADAALFRLTFPHA